MRNGSVRQAARRGQHPTSTRQARSESHLRRSLNRDLPNDRTSAETTSTAAQLRLKPIASSRGGGPSSASKARRPGQQLDEPLPDLMSGLHFKRFTRYLFALLDCLLRFISERAHANPTTGPLTPRRKRKSILVGEIRNSR